MDRLLRKGLRKSDQSIAITQGADLRPKELYQRVITIDAEHNLSNQVNFLSDNDPREDILPKLIEQLAGKSSCGIEIILKCQVIIFDHPGNKFKIPEQLVLFFVGEALGSKIWAEYMSDLREKDKRGFNSV